MPSVNREVADRFEQVAGLLELQGANPFRIRAYRNAARTIAGQSRSVKAMVEHGEDLDQLPGIGPDLAGKAAEIARTGTCALLERLRAEVPPDLGAMLQLPQLGPQRVRALHDELGVQSMRELNEAARQGRVAQLHGFGPRLQQQILEATASRLGANPERMPLREAQGRARPLLAWLRARPGVERAEPAGSLRRRRSTVGDLDLLVQSDAGPAVIDAFVRHPQVREVRAAGGTRATVVLDGGLQVDLRVVPARSFGAAWVYFTGSKAHNIALRRRAQRRSLKLNEYGLFRGREQIAGDDEASVYDALGLPWIAPEQREGADAIDGAGR